jgi:hypothetical protein
LIYVLSGVLKDFREFGEVRCMQCQTLNTYVDWIED